MEETVFKHLVFCHRDSMYRLAGNMLHNESEAQDIVQTIMLKLWQQKDRLAGLTNIKAYVMQAVKNECLNKMRQQQMLTRHLAIAGSMKPVSENIGRNNVKELIHGFINTLPQKQKLVMILKDVEEMENSEIARLLDMEEGAVRTNLARARQKLREWLQKIETYEQQQIQ
jgi:RNA polymerase sigma-70 factor (ECF subfamily)